MIQTWWYVIQHVVSWMHALLIGRLQK